MSGLRRAGLIVCLAVAGALGLPLTAGAHALLQSSDPAAGSVLDRAPAAVTVTFNEEPDPGLSRVSVLDKARISVAVGNAQPVPGNPLQLRVSLGPMTPGVYTVDWRTVSRTDGHSAAGSYAFGLQVAPPSSAAIGYSGATSETSALNWLVVGARALLYIGICAVLGALLIPAVGGMAMSARLRLLSTVMWMAALLGAVLVTEAQREDAHVGLGDVMSTSLGGSLLWRTLPLLATGIGLMAIRLAPTRQQLLLLVTGVLSALTMLGDVLSGHAAAESIVVVNVLLQWLHIVAAGVWIGGLGALLISLPETEDIGKARLIRRFSSAAGVCLAVIVVTGVIRATLEIGAWDQLFSTAFGWLIVVKVCLAAALALLGGINRYLHVPRVNERIGRLRRVVTTEVVLGVAALTVAAALVNVAPPYSQVAAGSLSVSASGADFATTIRIGLEVSPGTAGFNTFAIRVGDYDSGAPVDDATVRLDFHISDSAIGDSSLQLTHTGSGNYTGNGPNLSLDGTWTITALVVRPTRSEVVSLRLTTRSTAPVIDVNRGGPGLATLYTVHVLKAAAFRSTLIRIGGAPLSSTRHSSTPPTTSRR